MEFEAGDEICHVNGSSQQTVSGGWKAYWEKHMNPRHGVKHGLQIAASRAAPIRQQWVPTST